MEIYERELKKVSTPLNHEEALIDLEKDVWDTFIHLAHNLGYEVMCDNIDGNITAPLMDAFVELFHNNGIEIKTF